MTDQSRRAFLGAAAAAALPAAGVLAGCGLMGGSAGSAGGAGSKPAGSARPSAPAENTLEGDPKWWIQNLGGTHAIEGYARPASVLPGQQVQLYVSTYAPSFKVIALRIGSYRGALARRVWESSEVTGRRQKATKLEPGINMVSCAWEPSLSVPTEGWPEGSYVLRLDASTGPQRFVPLTVRSAKMAGKVVIKNAVSTWQAYNLWGGYDLYNGPGGGPANRSLVVSLDRPYDHQGAQLLMVFERKLISLAEGLGLPLAYATSMDIDADPHLLDGASALITTGHDEYWSPGERATVTAARDAGMNVAFFGANAMFRRVRYQASPAGAGRQIVCYKGDYTADPMYGKNNALVTSDFREPPDANPESSLTGTLYESNPTTADYVVVSPDSWLFAGTGVRAGSRFRGLVGDEYDRVNPVYSVQRPIEIVAHSPLTCRGVRSYGDTAYYTHAGGAGVFNSGTMRWVQSLADPIGSVIKAECTALTRKVTENVLRAFADGPAAAKYPARDNLVAMREWPGDPIAAQHDLWPPVVSLPGGYARGDGLRAPNPREDRGYGRIAVMGTLTGGRKRIAAAGVIVAAGVVLAGALAASASGPPLPSVSADKLLAQVLAAKPPGPMTAVVDETANLGFPALPDIPGMSASSPFAMAGLISGTHEFDIWYGGPKQVRIAMPVRFGETDLRVNGDQVWLWQSQGQTATHIVVPAMPPKSGTGRPGTGGLGGGKDPLAGLTPGAAARQLLALAGPSTVVSSAPSTTIAGHDAYQLLIEPRSGQSLIGRILVAFDAKTMLPLRVQVVARGSASTAFEVGYTSLVYGAPSASNFSFTPPPGAKVKTVAPASPLNPPARVNPGTGPGVQVLGKGWLTVVALPSGSAALLSGLLSGLPSGLLPSAPPGGGGAAGLAAQVAALVNTMLKSATPVSGSWGSGKLLSTTLFDVLITSKGQVLAGAVTPDVLYGDVSLVK